MLLLYKKYGTIEIKFALAAKNSYIYCQLTSTSLHLVYEPKSHSFLRDWEDLSEIFGDAATKSVDCIFLQLRDILGEVEILH